eukprot:SAG11_NODE_9380_length_917_cov_2.388753_1_plen_160_part_10
MTVAHMAPIMRGQLRVRCGVRAEWKRRHVEMTARGVRFYAKEDDAWPLFTSTFLAVQDGRPRVDKSPLVSSDQERDLAFYGALTPRNLALAPSLSGRRFPVIVRAESARERDEWLRRAEVVERETRVSSFEDQLVMVISQGDLVAALDAVMENGSNCVSM